MLNAKHALITLSNESDFTKLWTRRIWHIHGFPMRIFKWCPTFTLEKESPVVPIWVCFPDLPAHLYHKNALFAIANMVGTLCKLMIIQSISKLSKARICVEIDLLEPRIQEFDIFIQGLTINQKVEYEQISQYCSLCKHVGHNEGDCNSKRNAPKPRRQENFQKGKKQRAKAQNVSESGGGKCGLSQSWRDEIETDEIDAERHKGKKQSAVMNEQNQQSACKVFDERVLETANVSKGAIVGENYDSNDSGAVCDEENTLHVDDIEPNFVYEKACAETDASCAFGNDGERSKTIDSDNIIRELVVREPTKDRRDMKLRRIKTKDAIRLFQTFKKIGVVTKKKESNFCRKFFLRLCRKRSVIRTEGGTAEEWAALSLLFHWTEVGPMRWAECVSSGLLQQVLFAVNWTIWALAAMMGSWATGLLSGTHNWAEKTQHHLRCGAAPESPPAGSRNFHRSVSKTKTDHEDRLPTIYPVVLRGLCTAPTGLASSCRLRLTVNSPPWEQTTVADHHHSIPLFIASRTRPYPLIFIKSRTTSESSKSSPLLGLRLHFFRHLEPVHHRTTTFAGLSVANKTTRLDSINGASPGMAPFTFNPDDFPPLTSNSSESIQTNLAKTTSFQNGQNTESAARQSAHRLAKYSNFSKFFLANSNPPPIGATHDINGRPTVIFSDSETQSLVASFRLALIGKFSQGTPPYSQLHRILAKSGIKGAFTVSLINNKHALISLSNESDFTRLWLRRIWYLNGFPMRVFKWSPTFTPEQESSITPIWVSFPELPAHLYRKDALFAIANNIGTPLQIADSTLNQSNLAKARVCVEIYLLKPLLKEIDLKICGATIVHNIVYEHIPNYCSLCKHVGHRDAECYSNGDAPKPLHTDRFLEKTLQRDTT
ncbi:UNVERIFIED_CONTAM: hypothetical protein Scaly_1834800 [Sesamum calycinum]|uniref:DUF4283 domain-containing protein n=1 Tax=Sesamum calycinum TaxID=2727403 RepID=A0AAW2NE16_9LAMI